MLAPEPTKALFRIAGVWCLAFAAWAFLDHQWISVGVYSLPTFGLFTGAQEMDFFTNQGRQEKALLIPAGFIVLSLCLAVITAP
jgi:hypothetical protein